MMKKFLFATMLVFGLAAYAKTPQQILAEATPLEGQFNSEYNSGNRTGACLTGGRLVEKYEELLLAVRSSGQAQTSQGQHAIKNISDQITLISSVCK